MLPCVVHEDEHLLAVRKPAGINTHAPSPHAGEGIYDWLRHREPRWARLGIIHRLDKETSGVLVFAKTPAACRSLTRQFESGEVQKRYLFMTDRPVPEGSQTVRSTLQRVGDRYQSRPMRPGAPLAETVFLAIERMPGRVLVEAQPRTGRTHQIRVHAASQGYPVLGDALYGGSPFGRVCLHSAAIAFRHPADDRRLRLEVPADFDADARQALRRGLLDPSETDAFRLIHGAADGWPGLYVDRLGPVLIAQSANPLRRDQSELLQGLRREVGASSIYHKLMDRQVRRTAAAEASPHCVDGKPAGQDVIILENGLRFILRFDEGYSTGLFLDQRDNRRRLLVNHVAGDFGPALPDPASAEVLNTFAYTCGFSVCAAKAGARVTSLDLSRKYLGWGRRNFELNGLDPGQHDFIFGDAFDWLRRLQKKQRRFDAVLLDPPTFSQSKECGVFRAEKDFGTLATAALAVLKPGGVLFASTNAASMQPETFVSEVERAVAGAGRTVQHRHYVPQPPDFPITRDEPAHLKTIWLRMA